MQNIFTLQFITAALLQWTRCNRRIDEACHSKASSLHIILTETRLQHAKKPLLSLGNFTISFSAILSQMQGLILSKINARKSYPYFLMVFQILSELKIDNDEITALRSK